MKTRVAYRVAEWLKPSDLGKLENLKEIYEMLGIDGKVISQLTKMDILI